MDSNNQSQPWSPAIGLWMTVAAGTALVLCARILGPDSFYISEHEWRTALTAWWTAAEGHGFFDAITPLMGPPWHIPLEFPLFQWLAAHSTTPWLSLEDTGRALSFIFFLGCVFFVRRLALDMDLNQTAAESTAIVFASSPLFLSFSLSFTNESLALLFALVYLWLFVRWLLQPGLVVLMATILGGSVAAVVSPTTWSVFASAIAAIGTWLVLSARRHGRSTGDALVGMSVSIGIPLACLWLWIQWSDTVKAGNDLTAGLTSGPLLDLALGNLAQRLSPSLWGGFCLRSAVLILGPLGLIAVGPAILSFVKNRRVRAPLPVLAASLVALLAGPLVLTNLYFAHDYWTLPVGIFAILLLTSTLFTDKPRRWLLVMLVISNLATTVLLIAGKQAYFADPLSDGLARHAARVPPDHTIVVVGSFLDARVPYQAQRKALQSNRYDPSDLALRSGLASMKKEKVGAVLTRSAKGLPAARVAATILGLRASTDLAPGVTLWTSPALIPEATGDPIDLETEFSKRLAGFTASDDPGRWGILQPSGPDAALGIGFRFRGSLFLADIKRGIRVIHHRWSPEGRGG